MVFRLRVADYVPSSTRQGAEAFLKAIRRPRELFEYADDDLGSLPRIWADYNDGLITVAQAVERLRAAVLRASVQIIDAAASARDVVPDVIQNEQVLQNAAVEAALNHAAGLDNVATILAELAENLDGKELVRLAELSPIAWAQRLGYLIDSVRET